MPRFLLSPLADGERTLHKFPRDWACFNLVRSSLPTFNWVEDDVIVEEPCEELWTPELFWGRPWNSNITASFTAIRSPSDLACMSHECITGNIPDTVQAHTCTPPTMTQHPRTHPVVTPTPDAPTKQAMVVDHRPWGAIVSWQLEAALSSKTHSRKGIKMLRSNKGLFFSTVFKF